MPYRNGRDSAPTCGSMMDMGTGEILSECIASYSIATLLHSEIRFREAKKINVPKPSVPPPSLLHNIFLQEAIQNVICVLQDPSDQPSASETHCLVAPYSDLSVAGQLNALLHCYNIVYMAIFNNDCIVR